MLPSSEYAVKNSVSREVPGFANVNVNKVDIFYGIVLVQLACCSIRCILSLYLQCIYVLSVTGT